MTDQANLPGVLGLKGRSGRTDSVAFCASSPEAALLDDGEFWHRVFNRDDDYEFDDTPALPSLASPCPLCGSAGACGYDEQGRALIHSLNEEDDDA